MIAILHDCSVSNPFAIIGLVFSFACLFCANHSGDFSVFTVPFKCLHCQIPGCFHKTTKVIVDFLFTTRAVRSFTGKRLYRTGL